MTRARLLVACALVGLIGASGCSADSGPALMLAADPTISVVLTDSDIAPDEPVSFGSMHLCVSAPSTASVTKVSLDHQQGDVRIEAFAVRPNPLTRGADDLGMLNTSLADYGQGFQPGAPAEVSGVCPKDLLAPTDEEAAASTELGVQLRLASGAIGGGSGLVLTYTNDTGKEKTATVPFGVWLCSATCPPSLGQSPMPSN